MMVIKYPFVSSIMGIIGMFGIPSEYVFRYVSACDPMLRIHIAHRRTRVLSY